MIISGVVYVFFDMTFWLVMGLVAFQYWQMQKDQLKMFGVHAYSLRQQVVSAVLLGGVGGVLGSFILTLAGVTLNQLGLAYIWPVVLALMLINMRFMCFAYAGGLVAVANVLFGWPVVNVPQVLALVAGLHVTEALLIYISGRYGAVPVILKKDDGRLVGAFTLQNFWPLPLVVLSAQSIPEAALPAGIINMPDWWPPLPIGETLAAGHTWLYAMLPVVAALGYADIAVASTPAARRRQSAIHLALYSVLLMTLALLSAKYPWLQLPAALLSPLGHELLIQIDNRREMRGQPRFVPPERGVMVLDTVPSTPARKAGLRPGDIIIFLGDLAVNSGFELARAISFAPTAFDITVQRGDSTFRRTARFMEGERRLGVIIVPEGHEQHYVQPAGNRFGLLDWLKNRFRRGR